MGIGGEPAAFGQFLAKMVKVMFIDPALKERARINPGSGVALEINLVTREISRRALAENG